MKIKVYAVRYREDINPFIKSFYSDPTVENAELFIINNHSPLEQTKGVTHIYNNEIRPNFSTGHLARNWNQAIMNGFVDLDKPDCDAVIGCQIDCLLTDDWFSKVKEIIQNDKIHYFACGRGDEAQLFKPQIIKQIGLFDERNSSIFYQEADYFLRALLGAPENSVVLDYGHGRVFFPDDLSSAEKLVFVKDSNATDFQRQQISFDSFRDSLHTGPYTYRYFLHKWGINPTHWDSNKEKIKNLSNKDKEYILYPYFEDYGKINKEIYIVK